MLLKIAQAKRFLPKPQTVSWGSQAPATLISSCSRFTNMFVAMKLTASKRGHANCIQYPFFFNSIDWDGCKAFWAMPEMKPFIRLSGPGAVGLAQTLWCRSLSLWIWAPREASPLEYTSLCPDLDSKIGTISKKGSHFSVVIKCLVRRKRGPPSGESTYPSFNKNLLPETYCVGARTK